MAKSTTNWEFSHILLENNILQHFYTNFLAYLNIWWRVIFHFSLLKYKIKIQITILRIYILPRYQMIVGFLRHWPGFSRKEMTQYLKYQNPREVSSRSRIFIISLVYVGICIFIYLCHVSWLNEKRYRPEIWHTHTHRPWTMT